MTTAVVSSVSIDPTVVMSILDHHTRRGEKQQRVIGGLYGVLRNDVVEVRQTIPIPHEETPGSCTVGQQVWEEMARFYRKIQIAPLVGWYATGADPNDALLDPVFSQRATGLCIRLLLDGDLKYGGLRLRVLCAVETTLFGTPTRVYKHVPFEVRPCNTVQSYVVDGLVGSISPAMAVTSTAKGTPLHRLREEIDRLITFIDTAAKNKVQLPAETIYGIQRALRSLPRLPPEETAQLKDSAVQDVAATEYLSRVVSVQLTLIERLLTLFRRNKMWERENFIKKEKESILIYSGSVLSTFVSIFS